jgi:hypothetical protein
MLIQFFRLPLILTFLALWVAVSGSAQPVAKPYQTAAEGAESGLVVTTFPIYDTATAETMLTFTLSHSEPLGPDACVLVYVNGESRSTAIQDYLAEYPEAVITSKDGLSRTWTLPHAVLGLGQEGSASVLAVGLLADGELQDAQSRVTVSFAAAGGGNSGVAIDWPVAEDLLSIDTFADKGLETPSLGRAQASGVLVSLGSQDHLAESSFEVLANGNLAVQGKSLDAFLADPRVVLVSAGVNAVQVRIDAVDHFVTGSENSLEVRLSNADGDRSDTLIFHLSETQAILGTSGITMLDDEKTPMTVYPIHFTGPPGGLLELSDPSQATAFLENAFEPSLTLQLDAAGTATAHIMAFNELSFSGAPLVANAFFGGPWIIDWKLWKLCNVSITGADFKNGTWMRIGGKASYWASKGKYPRVGPVPGPHPSQGAIDRINAIWANYTIKAVFEDETEDGTDSSPPVDVSACRRTQWERLVRNGRTGGHYATYLDSTCLYNLWRGLDPAITDPDHIRLTGCRNPDAGGNFPAEIDLGTFHLTTDVPGC